VDHNFIRLEGNDVAAITSQLIAETTSLENEQRGKDQLRYGKGQLKKPWRDIQVKFRHM
jgi:hypothetical protein